jgi:hypothetical protein
VELIITQVVVVVELGLVETLIAAEQVEMVVALLVLTLMITIMLQLQIQAEAARAVVILLLAGMAAQVS